MRTQSVLPMSVVLQYADANFSFLSLMYCTTISVYEINKDKYLKTVSHQTTIA